MVQPIQGEALAVRRSRVVSCRLLQRRDGRLRFESQNCMPSSLLVSRINQDKFKDGNEKNQLFKENLLHVNKQENKAEKT